MSRIDLPVRHGVRWIFQKVGEFGKGAPWPRFLSLSAALASVCAYPVLFVYFHNVQESALSQVLNPLAIFVASGALAWIFFWLLSGRMARGALVTLFFMLVFMNYAPIDAGVRKLIPDWRWWRIAPAFLFLFVSLALLQRFFGERREADANAAKITAGIGAVFLALTVFNVGVGVRALAKIPRSGEPPGTAGHSAEPAPVAMRTDGRRPNFYFFVFDEYARQDVLKKYAGYDNAPFLDRLRSKKFNISRASRSSASTTRVSIGNLLFYSDQFRLDSETMAGIKSPPLLNVFKNAGYVTYVYCPVYRFAGGLTDVMLQSTAILPALSIERTVLEKSFFAFLATAGNEEIRADRLSLLKQAADVIRKSSPDPKFLFFHLLLPHEPFVFDENGGSVAYENMNNWINPKYYTGQLRFLSKKMDELADVILRSDPGAVVLMQSDHGARPFSGLSEEERLASFNVLYLAGQEADIEGLSTINTLRLAMNHALGLALKMLED
jgi:hypothetical protein